MQRSKTSIVHRFQKGFSLIEVILVIGVAAGIVIVALALGNKLGDSGKLVASRELAKQLTEVVDARFATFPNFAALNITDSSWVPGVAVDEAGNVMGPFGPVRLASATATVADDTWSMTFNQVPRGSCVEMLAILSANFKGSGANGVMSTSPVGRAMDPTIAEGLCNGGVNSVIFIANPRNDTVAAPVVPLWSPPPASSLPVWSPT